MNCYRCGGEVGGNVDQDRLILCGHCTDKRVKAVSDLEQETNVDILTTLDLMDALAIHRTKEERNNLGQALREARLSSGQSLRLFSANLGVDGSYLGKMERGLKPLNHKALALIREKKKGDGLVLPVVVPVGDNLGQPLLSDSKQDTDGQK